MTGGSRGIGRAICLALARLGQAVVVNYASRADAAEEVVRVIESDGGRAIACRANVALAADRTRLIEQTCQSLRPARCAGQQRRHHLAGPPRPSRCDGRKLDEVFGTNLKGPFFLSQLAARRMIELVAAGATAGGTIINVSSISAYAMSTNRADYCLAKAALQAMTWLFADRLAEERIQVFEVCRA